MCTVVVRWARAKPLMVLALRDEWTDRRYDDPGDWWPDHPGVVGGRDQRSGGTWCATHVGPGASAIVVNWPQQSAASDGAPSRGILPLLALRYGDVWPSFVTVPGMPGFWLLLASPERLTLWAFDGKTLVRNALPEGTSMLTPRGIDDGRAQRYLAAFGAARSAVDWRALVAAAVPEPDPAALLVRYEEQEGVFATVFGQVIESDVGWLRLSYSRTPGLEASWLERHWP